MQLRDDTRLCFYLPLPNVVFLCWWTNYPLALLSGLLFVWACSSPCPEKKATVVKGKQKNETKARKGERKQNKENESKISETKAEKINRKQRSKTKAKKGSGKTGLCSDRFSTSKAKILLSMASAKRLVGRQWPNMKERKEPSNVEGIIAHT